jgi:hypothetical protein
MSAHHTPVIQAAPGNLRKHKGARTEFCETLNCGMIS